MNLRKLSLITALFLVLSIYPIYAQEDVFLEDFEINAPAETYIYKCSPANTQFEVVNTGEVKSNYRIFLKEKWITASPSIFSLEPKQKQTILYTLNPSCSVKDKTVLKTQIETLLGSAKEFEQIIQAATPENIDVRVKSEASGMSCEKITFQIELFNLYNFEETYSLRTDKFEDEAEFSETEITLQPGKSKNTTLSIKTNDCALSGEFPFTLFVSTENTKLNGEVDLKLKLKSTNLVEQKKSEPVNIELNPGKDVKSGKYPLTLEIKIRDVNKTIEKSTTVQVINPDDNLMRTLTDFAKSKAGLYSGISLLTLIVLAVVVTFVKRRKTIKKPTKKEKEDKKVTQKEKISPLRVAQDLKAKKEELDLLEAIDKEHNKVWFAFKRAAGILLIITLLLVVGFFALKYQELIKQHIIYSLAGLAVVIVIILFAALSDLFKTEEQKIAEIEKKITSLKKREQKRKETEKEKFEKFKLEELERIKKEVDLEYRASNRIVPKTEIVERQKIKKDFRGFWTLVLILFVAGVAGVVKWKLNVFVQNIYFVAAGLGILAFLLLLKLLFCSGRAKKKWKIALVDERYEMALNWRKGLHNVSFLLQKPAEKLKLFVKRGKDKSVAVIPSKTTYGFLRIHSNVADDTFKELKLSFKVKLSWLKRKEVANNDVKLVKFVEGKWEEIQTEFLNDDGKFAYFQAVSNSPGQFALIGKPKPKKKEKRTGLIVLGTLFAIAIVVVTVLALTQQPQTPIKGIPDQSIDVNGVLKLDLSKYFSDPDSDKLIFTASKTEHLKIDFSDSTAVIAPELNWIGQEFATFFASDGKGGVAQSNKVIFNVKKPLIPSEYLPWIINGGVAFLLLLIVVLLVKYKNQLLKFLDEE